MVVSYIRIFMLVVVAVLYSVRVSGFCRLPSCSRGVSSHTQLTSIKGYQQSWEPERKKGLGDYSSYINGANGAESNIGQEVGKPPQFELWATESTQGQQKVQDQGLRVPLPNGNMPVTIKVVGVGGAGGNAINGMVSTTKNLQGVEFIAMNTDQQALYSSLAGQTLALGQSCTAGLGAGGRPEVGAAAANESEEAIADCLRGADIVFVTAGMGGGTGTGAAPVVAKIAQALGCLTIAVVTSPFVFEGRTRGRQAAAGLAALGECVDALLVVANDRLLQLVPTRMTMVDAFLVADDILRQGVIGTSELILRPGLINVDFADVRSIVKGSGTALIGIGTGTGATRATDAAVGAICSPLLDYPISGASGIIFNIVGGPDMTLTEVSEAARVVQENVHPDANFIIGALVDERAGKDVTVTVLATGFAPKESPQNGARQFERPSQTQAPPSSVQHTHARNERHQQIQQNIQNPPLEQPYVNGGVPKSGLISGLFRKGKDQNNSKDSRPKKMGVLGRLFGQ